MARYDNIHITPNTPRMGNAITRGIGDIVLGVMGWKIRGRLPNEKKVIIIGAPHTSFLDFFLAIGSMLSVGLRFSWMMKKQAFVFPFKRLLKALGGVPIDRNTPHGVTGQMADWFRANDNVWLGITPEGTRNEVSELKKGYLRIAQAADVPIFIVGVNAPTKEVILDRLWPLTGDDDADNRAIKDYFDKSFVGVNSKVR